MSRAKAILASMGEGQDAKAIRTESIRAIRADLTKVANDLEKASAKDATYFSAEDKKAFADAGALVDKARKILFDIQ